MCISSCQTAMCGNIVLESLHPVPQSGWLHETQAAAKIRWCEEKGT